MGRKLNGCTVVARNHIELIFSVFFKRMVLPLSFVFHSYPQERLDCMLHLSFVYLYFSHPDLSGPLPSSISMTHVDFCITLSSYLLWEEPRNMCWLVGFRHQLSATLAIPFWQWFLTRFGKKTAVYTGTLVSPCPLKPVRLMGDRKLSCCYYRSCWKTALITFSIKPCCCSDISEGQFMSIHCVC